eukprot:c6640_g1_i1.p1 GENE.c6640_g1_i1~~c6640_g1_i1.p1  ORF type:complete len:294 (+),score=56.43 c6640_g1_i1:55-936(+)
MTDNNKNLQLGAAAAAGVAVGAAAVWFLKKAPKASSPFGSINRPTAFPRSIKDLPVGDKPIQLYSLGTPNGVKVTVALEEMGLAYDAHTIQIMQSDQFTSGFTDINPNQKIPVLVDRNGPNGRTVRVFESGHILLYLAHKTGKFIPPRDSPEYVECLNWLFFQHGSLGPLFGQFGHFYKYATVKIPYAIERYTSEVKRLLSVIDQQLQRHPYIAGSEYTIADMALFPWILCIDTHYSAGEYIRHQALGRHDEYPGVDAWLKRCLERPAVIKGRTVNSPQSPSCLGDDKGRPVP